MAETARCLRRRWSLYHAGVLILLYADLMILAAIVVLLVVPESAETDSSLLAIPCACALPPCSMAECSTGSSRLGQFPAAACPPAEPEIARRKQMLKGFRDFILRGNVVDLAVAVILGAAFNAIVASW